MIFFEYLYFLFKIICLSNKVSNTVMYLVYDINHRICQLQATQTLTRHLTMSGTILACKLYSKQRGFQILLYSLNTELGL